MHTSYKHLLLIPLLTLSAVLLLSACSDDADDTLAPLPAAARGTWTDTRDGHVYAWVEYDGLQWMADNFAYAVEGATPYEDYNPTASGTQHNLEKYGRLYDYQQALDACPAGWRLPTDDDWQRLERALGMSARDAAALDWRGRIAPRMVDRYESVTDLGLQLGGYWTSHTIMGQSGYRLISVFGFYWTSTRDTSKDGRYYFYRKVSSTTDAVFRQSMEPTNQHLSVRYVRDAD